MNTDSSIRTQVALTLLPKLNSMLYLPLLEKCGGIEGFFCEKETALSKLYQELNIKESRINRLEALEKAEKELSLMDQHDIRICSIEHYPYPYLLRQCEDAPLVFYYKGVLNVRDCSYLAVVGTRKASERNCQRVEQMLKELRGYTSSLTIVSGLAFGIDIAAHQACLKHRLNTYAVLGHGLDTLYPASHKNTANKIIEAGGALISEYPCGSTILPVNFLQRNRIIAGLCQATLVVESAIKGGAMTTARLAQSYNRDVAAIPGRPEDKLSTGCNLLIKQNIAALVETSDDIARLLNIDTKRSPETAAPPIPLFGDNDLEIRISHILEEKGGMNIDELSVFSHIPISELTALLLKLELEEKVISLPGKNYIAQ